MLAWRAISTFGGVLLPLLAAAPVWCFQARIEDHTDSKIEARENAATKPAKPAKPAKEKKDGE